MGELGSSRGRGYMYACSFAKSCLTLCNPVECSPPGSSVHEIFQARVLEWVAISSSWIYVYLWLIHVVWQEPRQRCKAIILQLKMNLNICMYIQFQNLKNDTLKTGRLTRSRARVPESPPQSGPTCVVTPSLPKII